MSGVHILSQVLLQKFFFKYFIGKDYLLKTYDTRYNTTIQYDTFFMEIDTYRNPFLILKRILQYTYDIRYDT